MARRLASRGRTVSGRAGYLGVARARPSWKEGRQGRRRSRSRRRLSNWGNNNAQSAPTHAAAARPIALHLVPPARRKRAPAGHSGIRAAAARGREVVVRWRWRWLTGGLRPSPPPPPLPASSPDRPPLLRGQPAAHGGGLPLPLLRPVPLLQQSLANERCVRAWSGPRSGGGGAREVAARPLAAARLGGQRRRRAHAIHPSIRRCARARAPAPGRSAWGARALSLGRAPLQARCAQNVDMHIDGHNIHNITSSSSSDWFRLLVPTHQPPSATPPRLARPPWGFPSLPAPPSTSQARAAKWCS